MAPPIIKRFFISLEEHKLVGFISWAAVVAASTVFALQPAPLSQPTYRARGVLQIIKPPPTFTSAGQQLQQVNLQSINRNFLLSSRVIARAAEQLQYNPREINQIKNKIIIRAPQGDQAQVVFTEEGAAQIIFLEYSDPRDPNKAELVLTVFMQEMVEESRLYNSASVRTKIKALEARLAQVKEELRGAESAFYAYISKEGSDLLALRNGSLLAEITGSQQQQRQLQLALEEIQGQINSLVSQLGLTPEQAYLSSALSADPIIANLRAQILQQENQLELLSGDLRPTHPRMVELTKQKSTLEKLLQQRAREVIGNTRELNAITANIRQDSNLDPARRELANSLVALNTQKEGLLKQLSSLQETEQGLRQQFEKFPQKELERTSLIQGVESNRALYRNILNVLVDARSAEAETVGSLEIYEEPVVGQVKPQLAEPLPPPVIIAAGAGLGVVAAAGIIFLFATLDARFHTAQEIKSFLIERELLSLGELPLINLANEAGEITPILTDIDSIYLPTYERFRSNLRRFGSESARVLIISSVSPGEGKSVTAYNLAIASALAGKRTLLIEADLRSSSQASIFKIAPDPQSLVEPLRYLATRSNCIRLVPEIENLYLVPSPGPQRKAAAIIESNEIKALLEDARRRFDLVVIDTPSLGQANDALLLESLTDGIVMVTRPGYTQGNLLNEAIEQMQEAEIEIIGGVINGLSSSKEFEFVEEEELLEEQENLKVGANF